MENLALYPTEIRITQQQRDFFRGHSDGVKQPKPGEFYVDFDQLFGSPDYAQGHKAGFNAVRQNPKRGAIAPTKV